MWFHWRYVTSYHELYLPIQISHVSFLSVLAPPKIYVIRKSGLKTYISTNIIQLCLYRVNPKNENKHKVLETSKYYFNFSRWKNIIFRILFFPNLINNCNFYNTRTFIKIKAKGILFVLFLKSQIGLPFLILDNDLQLWPKNVYDEIENNLIFN